MSRRFWVLWQASDERSVALAAGYRTSVSRSSKLKVAVLLGGQSPEHDVSVTSGLNVIAALDPHRYDVVAVFIDRQGRWHFGVMPSKPCLTSDEDGGAPRVRAVVDDDAEAAGGGQLATDVAVAAGALERLRYGAEFDVAFVALHGAGGEDGSVQGLLTLAGLPFTGSAVLASALAMDKPMAKEVYRRHRLSTPSHRLVGRAELQQLQAADERGWISGLMSEIELPCVVKPASCGSSVATCVVEAEADLLSALRQALAADHRALVESYMAGSELTCGVLGGGNEPTEALLPTEIVPLDGGFFDFRAKYTASACEEITPARLPPTMTRRVQELSVIAHEALGCEGMSRSDFMLAGDEPVILETNTIPGLTDTSLLPQGAAAAGIAFPALLDRLIRSALLRAGQKLCEPL